MLWVSLGAVCLISIAALFAYLYWQNIQRWRYRDARRWADAQHVEVALPLDDKEAAFTCGKLLKIDKAGFISKLDILERMRQVVRDSGFTDEEIKESGSLLGETAYMAYVWGFMTFDKSLQSVKMQWDDMVKKNIDSLRNKWSSEEGKQMDALLPSINQMQLRAFDLGRRDARLSPCPYLHVPGKPRLTGI
jgi:hypothetical protein